MNWIQKWINQRRVRALAHTLQEEFARFAGRPQGLRLTVANIILPPVEMLAYGMSATLELLPAAPLESPDSLVSCIKAKLYCLMSDAVAGDTSMDLLHDGIVATIEWEGREFNEPAWRLQRGKQCCGPIGFRHGEWNRESGRYEFSLMAVNITRACNHASVVAEIELIRDLAFSFRDNVRHIDI